jgi:hypothetical protein
LNAQLKCERIPFQPGIVDLKNRKQHARSQRCLRRPARAH